MARFTGVRSKGRRVDVDSEPLLSYLDLTAVEAVELDGKERRSVVWNAVVLALLAALDVAMVLIDAQEAFRLAGFDVTTMIGEVSCMLAIRSLMLVVSAATCACERGGEWLLPTVYWTVFSSLTYGIGKLIMFNFGTSKASVIEKVALLSWIGLGVAEIKVIYKLEHWREERKRWETVQVAAQEQVEAGSANAQAVRTMRRKIVDSQGEASAKQKEQNKMFWKKSFWQVLKPYFWPKGAINKLRCIMTWVFLGISKACNLVSPLYIGRAVQELNDMDKKPVTQGEVTNNLIIFSVLVLASKVFKELQNMIYLNVRQTAYAEIASQTFEHLHSLSLEWHLKKKMGNVLRSMDRGLDAANTLVQYLFLYLGPSMVECAVVFVIFYTHFQVPAISATAFISLVAYATITIQVTLWRKRFREMTNKHDNDYHDKATDSLINYETVKYFTAERFEIDRYTSSIMNFQKYASNTLYSLSLLNNLQSLVIQVCSCVALIIAANAILNGTMQVGQFVAINAYILNLFAPLSFLGSVYNAVIQAIVDMQNLSDMLQEQPDLVDADGAKPLIAVPSGTEGASVEFRNVVFHYPSLPADTGLRNVSFKIEPGTTTAIVGPTGAGKSTIARLLFRFYDPLGGRVLVSNQDIRLVTQHSLRSSVGVVPQDTVLFNDSILHNISYGKPDATEAEIEAACESAQILDFIRALPEGFETQVGERGLRLSGGEKQRVAIARCLLKNPPVVILDEATSALDTITERSVQMALSSLTEKRTVLVIAHRLHSIKNAEQILVLDKGEVVERGSHDQLLALNGSYADLWNSRLEEPSTVQSSSKETDVVSAQAAAPK